ncbi:MAG: M48 family metalloprotease [Planctomycetes bacterium]|nr:M48 family metalloprotease [Planctomycetota bacterium]
MPDLLYLLAALLVGILYDEKRGGPFPPDPRLAVAAVLGGVLVVALFGLVLSRRLGRAGRGWARAYVAFRVHPVALQAAIVHLFHWPAVARPLGLERSWTALACVHVLPFLAIQGVVWAWAWKFEAPAGVRLRAWLGFHYRSTALLLAPYLLYAAANDALSLSRTASLLLGTWSLAGEAAAGALFAALAFLLPVGARRIWKTRPLGGGPLRERLEATARRLSFRCRDLLVWDTAGLVANAAIVGFLPRWRYVIFTDALLGVLHPAEIEAVFGHEAGHAMRRHIATFLAFGGAWALAVLDVASAYLPDAEESLLLLLVPSAFLGWLGFGWLSRRFELEADLYGAAAIGDVGTFVSALERVGVVAGATRRRGSWRHFSVGSRVAFLRLVEAAPEVGERFVARMRLWLPLGLLALAAAVAVHVVDRVPRTPGELGWAYLRLGDYARAESFLARAAPQEEEARQRLDLARLARKLLAETGGDPDALLGRVRDALAEGDLDTVRRVVDLLEARAEGGEPIDEMRRLLEKEDREGLAELFAGEGRDALDALCRPPE